MMPNHVRVRFFATAREAVGRSVIAWPVPPEGLRAELLLREIVDRYPRLQRVVGHSRLVVNGEYVEDRAGPVLPGDEFAIHPPYSGG